MISKALVIVISKALVDVIVISKAKPCDRDAASRKTQLKVDIKKK
jgi:hypothetical protein